MTDGEISGPVVYRNLLARWMAARQVAGGELSEEEESRWAAECNDAWQELTAAEQEELDPIGLRRELGDGVLAGAASASESKELSPLEARAKAERAQFPDEKVIPLVLAIALRGTVSAEEWGLPLNSYERALLEPLLPTELFVEHLGYCLSHCSIYSDVVYEGAVIRRLGPEACRRLAKLAELEKSPPLPCFGLSVGDVVRRRGDPLRTGQVQSLERDLLVVAWLDGSDREVCRLTDVEKADQWCFDSCVLEGLNVIGIELAPLELYRELSHARRLPHRSEKSSLWITPSCLLVEAATRFEVRAGLQEVQWVGRAPSLAKIESMVVAGLRAHAAHTHRQACQGECERRAGLCHRLRGKLLGELDGEEMEFLFDALQDGQMLE